MKNFSLWVKSSMLVAALLMAVSIAARAATPPPAGQGAMTIASLQAALFRLACSVVRNAELTVSDVPPTPPNTLLALVLIRWGVWSHPKVK